MLRILIFLSITIYSSFGYNVSYMPEAIKEIRAGDTRTLQVRITSNNDSLSNQTTFIQCIDTFVCEAEGPSSLYFSEEDDEHYTEFNVTIFAKFVGITHLNITIGDKHIDPAYKLRIRRSVWEHTKAKIFMIVLVIFIPIVTFLMGTQLEWSKIAQIGKRPIGPLTGMLCQFLVMPTVGYLLAKYIIPEDQSAIKLALFAASTCPGGGKSSFWTIIYGGNLDLSVSMTFTQNIAALVMMPIWIGTVGREFSNKELRIPYMDIVKGLLALMIPTILGMIFIHFKRHLYERIQKWIKTIVWIATFVFFAASIFANFYIVYLLTWPIALCGCVLPWSGYILAFIIATIFQQDYANKITIAIETGIQHVGIALVLLMWTLPEPEVDLAIVILFVIILVTDKPLVILYGALKCYRKCRRNKGKVVDAAPEIDPSRSEKEIIDSTTDVCV